MAARITLNAVNLRMAQEGYTARLAKVGDYFYFQFGEAADWLDRTVRVPTISSLSVDECLAEFRRLNTLNGQILAKAPRQKRNSGTSTPTF